METIKDRTIRDIAIETPGTTRVFEEYRIDYCCGGNKSFEEACSAAGVDPMAVAQKIDDVLKAQNSGEKKDSLDSKSLSEIIEYIVAKHHIFTVGEIERLIPLMDKVCARHGDQHPELYELKTNFTALADSLIPHLRKEEQVLFPYIQELESSIRNDYPLIPPHFGTVANPIRMMMVDHEEDGKRLNIMRRITNEYTLPQDACPSFTALYAGLEDLERDLHRHIHVENNILFPEAIQLERSLAEEP